MRTRGIVGLCTLVGLWALAPSPAEARVSCGNHGPQLVAEVEAATSVFTARLEGPAAARHPVPAGHRGRESADLELVVTRVFKGPLQVGDRVTVRWEGWSELIDGPIVGGCRVPGTEPGEQYPYEMLVIATGDASHLSVANRSSSERIGRANRTRVQQVARLALRARQTARQR